jgi:multicomponent Na+:H+ antiporter subunit E
MTLQNLLLHRIPALVRLLAYFLVQLVLANLKMAYFTLAPLSKLKPGIVAVPLEPMSETALMVLANLITLTPGTLSVDVSPDNRTLYIHVMEVTDPQAVIDDIKHGFEKRVLEVMR